MIVLLFLLLMALPASISAHWTYIPFDDAMKQSIYSEQVYTLTKKIIGLDGHDLYNFFKNIYETNCSLEQSAEIRIPKIIHQIWLGSPVPESFKALQQSWVECHMGRGWSYKLWTDEDVAELNLYNQEFYDATDNYGVKADILRLEVLYMYGGVYADMDCECLRALDDLHYTYDFYVGIQPLDSAFVQLGNALIASRAGHPILHHCITTIKDDWHLQGAPKKTGPIHFTKSFCTMVNKNGNRDIAFPAFYFNPLGCQETTENRKVWTQQGAFTVHWWAKSWMPKNYRPKMFNDINNDASTVNWND